VHPYAKSFGEFSETELQEENTTEPEEKKDLHNDDAEYYEY
jgi:hypothetical protein